MVNVPMSLTTLFLGVIWGAICWHDDVSSSPPDAGPARVEQHVSPFEGITIDREARTVHVRAWVALQEGFLEQIACSPGTREHETLMVVRAKPSDIHAALLLLEYQPGQPGRWMHHAEKDKVELIAPRGPAFEVLVRYENKEGETVTHHVRQWIRDHHGKSTFPEAPWIFGGSQFKPNPEFMGPGEHYVADMTGSIIGLVTFGDELLGFQRVIADQAAIHEPAWEVDTDKIPDEGTPVTLILKPYKEQDRTKPEANNEAKPDAKSGSHTDVDAQQER